MKEAEYSGGRFVLSGEIDSSNADEFYAVVTEQYEKSPKDVEFSCEGLDFVDSTTLGTIVKIKKMVQKNGHKVILTGLKPKIKKLFVICNLDAILEIQ